MTAPAGSTPESQAGQLRVQQIAIAARLLELVAIHYGTPGYEQLAADFERTHRSSDVVSGLLIVAQFTGRIAARDDETYMRMLAGWQLLGEIADLDPNADPAT